MTPNNNALLYQLRGLGMSGTVLHIGAHPDDEDGGLMAYIAHKHNARIIYWSATRGEGGQNRIGHYTGDALGIYRSWESLDARMVDGGQALFGPFYDFGFCKTAAEAQEKWGREKLVKEIVRAIRMTQPQIVISRWTGRPSDGHGHHRAVGQAALEAVELAGDPAQFPELGAGGLAAWQPSKVYLSTGGDWQPGEKGNFGQIQPDLEKEGILRINTGEFDPISNLTYQEQAWIAINQHRSQAMGFIPNRGDYYYYYILYKSLVPVDGREGSFFDGLDSSLAGLADYPAGGSDSLRSSLTEVTDRVDAAYAQFRFEDRVAAANLLLEGLERLRQIYAGVEDESLDDHVRKSLGAYLRNKIRDFEEVTARCLGLQLECRSNRARVTPGEHLQVTARVWNRGQVLADEVSFTLHLPDEWDTQPDTAVTAGAGTTLRSVKYDVIVPTSADLTCPYWLVRPHDGFCYHWPAGGPAGNPFSPPVLEMECKITIGHNHITLREPVVLKDSFPGGFRELPVAVVPPISLHPDTNKMYLLHSSEEQSLELHVIARSNKELEEVKGVLTLETPAGWKAEPTRVELSLNEAGDTETVRFVMTVPGGITPRDYQLKYVVHTGDRDYDFVLNPVRMGAPGLPTSPDANNCVREEFVIAYAAIMVYVIDVKITKELKYAYVQGLEENLLNTLIALGFDFTALNDTQLRYSDLSEFDAIVVGPNAYLMRDELAKNASRIRDYVDGGGTLIVQYHGYGYQDRAFSPYPFTYNQPHDRVTNENAPVEILKPDHILLNQPNRITESDFSGWVHDRGLYFFGSWDKRYEPILSSHDPDEEPKAGGLVLTSYGYGNYLYTGYSFFRQLPAGVKGAFRLFANLLALPVVRIKERGEILRKVSLFSFMTEEQLTGVARLMTERWEKNGVYLCHQGDVGNELYIISQGEVEIINETGGRDQIINTETIGAYVGELAVLENIPRTLAMRTKGDVRLLVLQGARFQTLIQQHPDIAYHLIKILARRLAEVISGAKLR
ncbi:MAG: cyclic nucleotide-binding domain-containing protein [Bacteroidota bacterium]